MLMWHFVDPLQLSISPTLLQAAFTPIFFCQKITNPQSVSTDELNNIFVQKAVCEILVN